MRRSFAATLAAFAVAGLTSLPAAAATGSSFREAASGARNANDGTAPHLHLAWGIIDDDDDVRPRRRARAHDRWERPRRAKPAPHARAVKRARKHARRHARRHHGYAPRQARGMGRQAARAQRRVRAAAMPATGGLTGIASYYGGGFHGRPTASGVRFNANGLTAAHRTLPFGTRVRVTHLGNGRSVDVVINDRGPFIGGRIIDLSRGAAGVIGMHGQGIARVRVSVLGRR